MASKVKVERFDRVNKGTLRVKGNTTRTGASTARNRFHAHGRHHKHR